MCCCQHPSRQNHIGWRASFCRSRLAEVKHKAEGVSDIAAWNGCIFLLYGAACRDQPVFLGLNIGYKELKDGTVFCAFFDVQRESTRLEAHQRGAVVRDRQTEDGSVKRHSLVKRVSADNNITGALKYIGHGHLQALPPYTWFTCSKPHQR